MQGYYTRCQMRLEEIGAPTENWDCSHVIDQERDGFVCELCGCEKVRFIHVMEHRDYPDQLSVGCICAGTMEGNLLAAKERDKKMKNRAKRKENFQNHIWKKERNGIHTRTYQGKKLAICANKGVYECWGSQMPIMKSNVNFKETLVKIFDIVDPEADVMK
ncbi:MAG: hypothetical protein R3Y63_04860 [Eubacteriales bacterium]